MPDEGGHNFGDYLMQLIGEEVFLPDEWSRLQNNHYRKYVLLGSFICDYTLNLVAELNKHPIIVGCGYRGEVLSPRLVKHATFLGCRGKHSMVALAEVGVDVDWVGDPAVIMPLLIRKKRRGSRKNVFMPHINDPLRHEIHPEKVGCDKVLQPSINGMEQLKETVREISGASFVLAGAMHAAIIAYAYCVPFAFYATEGGYRDCPPKWADWLSSISSPYVPPAFFSHQTEGINWYRQNMSYFHPPKYVLILNEYAAIGKLRRSIVWKAVLHDACQMHIKLISAIPERFSDQVNKSGFHPSSEGVFSSYSQDLLVTRKVRKPADSEDRL